MGQGLGRKRAMKKGRCCAEALAFILGELAFLGARLQFPIAARKDSAQHLHHLHTSEGYPLADFLGRRFELKTLPLAEQACQRWIQTDPFAVLAFAIKAKAWPSPLLT